MNKHDLTRKERKALGITWTLEWKCPNFYEDMPDEDNDKIYSANAYTVVHGRMGMSREDVPNIKGLRKAYVVARQLALNLESRLLHRWERDGGLSDEIGIDWEIGLQENLT